MFHDAALPAPPQSLCIIATCVVSVGLLLWAERQGLAGVRAGSKTLAALSFVALALSLGALDAGVVGVLILIGLVFCVAGDIFLLSARTSLFLAGMGAFAAGHLAYAAAFVAYGGLALKPGVLLAAALLAAATLWTVTRLWTAMGVLRQAVAGYCVIISTMALLSVAVTPPQAPYHWLFITAAFGFALSDISVARDRFGHVTFTNRLWGLPLYFAAQLLFAASVSTL